MVNDTDNQALQPYHATQGGIKCLLEPLDLCIKIQLDAMVDMNEQMYINWPSSVINEIQIIFFNV